MNEPTEIPAADPPAGVDEEARLAALGDLHSSLTELEQVAETNIARAESVRERIRALRDRLAEGVPLPDVVAEEPQPLIVELVTENIRALQMTGLRLRRAEAAALRAHGLTITRIAELFGVSRQRVWAILRDGT
jgi:hypothetical protein